MYKVVIRNINTNEVTKAVGFDSDDLKMLDDNLSKYGTKEQFLKEVCDIELENSNDYDVYMIYNNVGYHTLDIYFNKKFDDLFRAQLTEHMVLNGLTKEKFYNFIFKKYNKFYHKFDQYGRDGGKRFNYLFNINEIGNLKFETEEKAEEYFNQQINGVKKLLNEKYSLFRKLVDITYRYNYPEKEKLDIERRNIDYSMTKFLNNKHEVVGQINFFDMLKEEPEKEIKKSDETLEFKETIDKKREEIIKNEKLSDEAKAEILRELEHMINSPLKEELNEAIFNADLPKKFKNNVNKLVRSIVFSAEDQWEYEKVRRLMKQSIKVDKHFKAVEVIIHEIEKKQK